MIHFYILPLVLVNGARNPKYFSDGTPGTGISCPWGCIPYGSIDMCITAADITQADHDYVSSQADVYTAPDNLDVIMTLSERQAMNNYLEAHAIPADWLSPGDTFHYALRIVAGIFQYIQRVLALVGYPANPFAGLTLNTRYSNIPNPLHDALYNAAVELGYSWNVGNNDQIRKIWKMMADQWGSSPIYMNVATL